MSSQTFADVFDRLYFDASSEREKGSRFERMLQRYLQVEPKFADQFSNVWLWQEWPGREGRPDTGIDLVAEDRYTHELTAIQAKFYDPARKLQKHDIDSFFTELGKEPFREGLVVTTAQGWSKHADAALEGQSKPVQRLGLGEFAESTIDWDQFSFDRPDELVKSPHKEPRKYQREAIDHVRKGLELHDRGKLIMACGTGKTFTSLRLVEEQVPVGGTVLFLVPSIALLQQTLNEWTAQASVPLRSFAVCSDTSVGKSKNNEDLRAHDLGFPASTDPEKLAARFKISTGETHLNVVFSTYQSIEVIQRAQALGLPEFDLIVCDEAHRTTGASIPGTDDSAFVRVHDNANIKAKKRLYMTATPRIYGEETKAKATDAGTLLASMDDEAWFGPEFHHLGFGKAVEMGHLTDYKVLILAVDEESVASKFQDLLAEQAGEMGLDDVARMVGCWNGLSKRGVNGEQLAIFDTSPMRRAVAFARNIKESKAIADQFDRVGRELLSNRKEGASTLKMQAEHVDGTFSVMERSAKLNWLEEDVDGDVCRILTNAKCLSEGVDVPTLDAVLFLNPRNSQVDVVQSVGRVMRRAEGKEYGYIILPIAVAASQDPATALNDNKKYKVVWDVLQALRAHDDRFEATINKMELDKGANKTIDVIGIGDGFGDDGDSSTGASDQNATEALFTMSNAADWQDAIYARMVKKVGDRKYWDAWAEDVKDIADRQVTRIKAILASDDPRPSEEFDVFLQGLRGNLNDGISRDDAIDMLVQHLITKPVFNALFEDFDFASSNPVSQVMDSMLAVLDSYNLDSETSSLEEFYRSVRVRAEGVSDATGKQKIVNDLYEKFFRLAFPRVAASLGIVYTPLEVVDFILNSVDDALQEHFGARITDEGVHVLDPFTGTGTFITRLLTSGLIEPADLLRKYTQELHANELLLLAYYIAAINIEATFHSLRAEAGHEATYKPFNGIVLTDTFQMAEEGDTLDTRVFTNNNDRVVEQNNLDIRVIIGNPPYLVGQSSANDNNSNVSYPTLDASIERSYVNGSAAKLKRNLYDSYVRAIRWASNRILTSPNGGIVSFVTNGSYIDSISADKLRKTLSEEFHEIYVYNLRGNQKQGGEFSAREGGKIFGSGSRATIAILLLVKKPGQVTESTLHYKDIGDYVDRETKLSTISKERLGTLSWEQITPGPKGDWINQRDSEYDTFPMISASGSKNRRAVFEASAPGLVSSRDPWVYGSSARSVRLNSDRLIAGYNAQLADWIDAGCPEPSKDFVTNDSRVVSWSAALRRRLTKKLPISPTDTRLTKTAYRPFQSQHLALQRALIERPAISERFFPAGDPNPGLFVVAPGGSASFSCLATDSLPDFHLIESGQFMPRYSYTAPSSGTLFDTAERRDNITDWALNEYREQYGAQVTKDDIFYYVYGLLHSTEYRSRYAAELKKQAPRIPMTPGRDRFESFAAAGRELSSLHIDYEKLTPYAGLTISMTPSAPKDEYERYAVTKIKYARKGDKSTIIYNAFIKIGNIPLEVQEFLLGPRSALDWVLDRYQLKTDRASGIVNDPNDWSREHEQPRFILDLIGRIVTLSLETKRIVNGLPDLGL